MRRPRVGVLFFLVLVVAVSAQATTLYSFSYTTTSAISGTAIQDVSFSFTVPTFAASGDTPAFTAFSLTDGTNSASLTADLLFADVSGSCIEFGTAADSTLGNCSVGANAPDGGFLFLSNGNPLPTANGPYAYSATAVFYFGPSSLDESIGTVTLTVSDVTAPEPASIALIGTGLAWLGWRRRSAVRRP